MKIVLDTNVLVSGLLSPYGSPGEIVRMVAGGEIKMCYDARILQEYIRVLSRPKFGFDKEDIEMLINQMRIEGYPTASQPLKKRLPHRDDEPFMEVALAGKAVCLVTGNLKHFPQAATNKVKVVNPRQYLELLRKK